MGSGLDFDLLLTGVELTERLLSESGDLISTDEGSDSIESCLVLVATLSTSPWKELELSVAS